MCGITGILKKDCALTGHDYELLKAMNDKLAHRGPDDSGIYKNEFIGLGHRRLSIIDLNSGKQPIHNEDKTIWIVFNGEIYNYASIYNELLSRGHVFYTKTDTEVIIHAWEEWGEACVEKFRGMFVFAIWDQNKKLLFVARDRFGIKPLYYSTTLKGDFVFASELKSLMTHPDIKTDINYEAIEDYFAFGYIPDPKSIYKNIYKLMPGHYFIYKQGNTKPMMKQYWDINIAPNEHYKNEQEIQEELIVKLKESIELRMIADVPVGAFLSGGVDSSSVVALMSEIAKKSVTTCSISFDNDKYDESEYSKLVSDKYSSRHLTYLVNQSELIGINRIGEIFDEPFADSSAIPTYEVCRLARNNVSVALSGDGSDEMLLGYGLFKKLIRNKKIQNMLPESINNFIVHNSGFVKHYGLHNPVLSKLETLVDILPLNDTESIAYGLMITSNSYRNNIYSHPFKRKLGSYNANDVVHKHAQNYHSDDILGLAQYLVSKIYLTSDILVKVDRASMANSLEVRVPFLDHKLAEWFFTIPSKMKMNKNESKYILKKAMEERLPHKLLYRRKMGFSVPLKTWLNESLNNRLNGILSNEKLNDLQLFDMKNIGEYVKQHSTGQHDHSAFLWSLIMFEEFANKNIS